MPQIGPLEILVVAVLALVVFGPERLPEMGRSLGKGMNQLKRMASEVKSEFDLSLEDEKETTPAPKAAVDTEVPQVAPGAAVAPSNAAPSAAAPVGAVDAITSVPRV